MNNRQCSYMGSYYNYFYATIAGIFNCINNINDSMIIILFFFYIYEIKYIFSYISYIIIYIQSYEQFYVTYRLAKNYREHYI